MLEKLRTARGVIRSLRVYYADRERRAAMQELYAAFVRRGDLVFDIGAHVGDRTAAFRALGARVVAVEPQPALARTLRLLFGRDPDVSIECAAVGRTAGTAELMVNIDNPTVSTASSKFVAAARDAEGWKDQIWSKRLLVNVVTLDSLIARYGRPTFVKIDVEGLEADVLDGLSQNVPALSFEFTTIQRGIAQACLERCSALGYSAFNAALGETQKLVHSQWIGASAMARWISGLPHAANSGDVYARI